MVSGGARPQGGISVFRKNILMTMLLCAGLCLAAACSDDDGPGPVLDSGPTTDGPVTTKEGGPDPDGAKQDKGGPSACVAACTSKKPYLCVKDSTGKCVECSKNVHCSSNPGSLGATCSKGLCSCAKDGDCAGKAYGSKCDTSVKVCSCKTNSDCKAPAKCVGSLFGAKVCAKPCTADKDCTSSTYKYCNKGTGKCVACKSDADCSKNTTTKYCNVNLGSCVACKTSAHCASQKVNKHCDGATGKCSECANDSHCKSGYKWGNKCTASSSGKICRCKANSDCAGNPNGPTCYTKYNKCSCKTNADCKKAPYLLCDVNYAGATYKNCLKKCTSHKDCTDTSAPYCDAKSGKCAGCLSNAHCANGTKPICKAGKCDK